MPAFERELLRTLCARRVDGLLVVPCGDDLSYLSTERAHGTPIVAVDRPAPGIDVDSVVSANAAGVRAGVQHLIGHGHRRIGFVGDTARFTGPQRLRGYQEALAAAGIEGDATLIRRVHETAAARVAVGELLAISQPPTAIFAGNNLLTRGAIQALAGRRHDIALVGFDDFALAEVLEPPVAVVAQDAVALGRSAAELLFRRLAGDLGPQQQLVLATQLVPRASADIRPPARSAATARVRPDTAGRARSAE